MPTLKYYDGSDWQYAAIGKIGPTGPTGVAVGLPTGGATGASLIKSSSTDYATEWSSNVGGLVLIETTTATAVAAINVDDCFSATYDNYKIVITGFPVNADIQMTMRLRVSGADNSTTNYSMQRLQANSGTVAALRETSQAQWVVLTRFTDNAENLAIVELANPFNSKKSVCQINSASALNGGHIMVQTGIFDATTSFDGFSLISSSGNFDSVTLSVFGYRK